ncbi:MAG: SprT family zinc-dependent metalloprotease, partial [Anaerolineaceae bacterium]
MVNANICTTRVEGEPLRYQVKWSARARRYRLAVSTEGVSVTLPAGVPASEADRFIQQNSSWLKEQLRKLERRRAKSKVEPLPADVILLRGKAVQVKVLEESVSRSRALVREAGGRLEMRLPAGARKDEVLEAALRKLAREEVERAVAVHSRIMRLSPGAVSIRDQRTRWGSCSSRGTLSFNWRLVMAPPEVLNYVVVHELAHLKVPNHSREFWALVARYDPAFKEHRLWLKRKASLLRPDLL